MHTCGYLSSPNIHKLVCPRAAMKQRILTPEDTENLASFLIFYVRPGVWRFLIYIAAIRDLQVDSKSHLARMSL